MNTLEEKEASQSDYPASPVVKIRIFQQMAEALEDEASALNRRATSFEEEETSLVAIIQEHQTNINRLNLRLQALRSEHNGLMEKVSRLEEEAAVLREEAYSIKQDIVLTSAESGDAEECDADGFQRSEDMETLGSAISAMTANHTRGQEASSQTLRRSGSEEGARTSIFFNRMTLTDYASLENLVK